MEKKELVKKLEKLEFKQSILKTHKAQLKQLLEADMSFSRFPRFSKKSHFKWRELFHFNNPFTMKLVKKSIPVGVLAVLAVIFTVTQWSFTPAPVALAQEILQQAMTDLSTLHFTDEKSKKELEFKLKILEEAQKSNDLMYLGEEKWHNGTRVKKISFNDQDLPTDLTILIGSKNSLLGEVYFEFKDQTYLPFEVFSGEVKDGKIVDKEALIASLKDSTIKKQWIKDLIRWNNEKCLEEPQQTKEQQEAFQMVSGETEDHRKLQEDFKTIIPSAEVVLMMCSPSYGYTSYDGNGKLNSFSISFYSLGNQKQKLAEAQSTVEQTIQKLSSGPQTEETKLKVEMLKRAKNAPTLRHQDWKDEAIDHSSGIQSVNLSFRDSEIASTPIEIEISQTQVGEPEVEFRFIPDFNSDETKAASTIVEGKVEQGKALDLEKFKDKELAKNPLKNLIIELIVKPQNRGWFEKVKQRSGIPANFAEVFEPIVNSSEVLIFERPYYSLEQGDGEEKAGKINGYALKTYSFGLRSKYDENPEGFNVNPKALIEQAAQKVSQFNSEEAQMKLEVLKQLSELKDLRYDGEDFFVHKTGKYNGSSAASTVQDSLLKKFKRYSAIFDFEGRKTYMGILIDPNDQSENFIQFELPFFGDGVVKSIKGKILNGKIVNVDEIVKELASPASIASMGSMPKWMKYLIRVHNEKWLQTTIMPTAQCYDAVELVKKLKPLIEKSEVAVTDLLCPGTTEKKSTEFILNTYSLF